MHAPASSGEFLAHTISSRVTSLKINGIEFSETRLLIELLAENGIPVVMVQGESILNGIMKKYYSDIPFIGFDRNSDMSKQRMEIINNALNAELNFKCKNRNSGEKLKLELEMKDGEKTAARWKTEFSNGKIISEKDNFTELFGYLVKIIFLKPFIAKAPRFYMFLYNLYNRILIFFIRK